MNKQEILERLTAVEKNLNKDIKYYKDIVYIINSLKSDIAVESVKSPTEKKAFKKCESFLKKGYNARPVLKVASKIEKNGITYTAFTNSFSAFYLTEKYADNLPILEKMTAQELERFNLWEGVKYPDIGRLLPDYRDGKKIDVMDYQQLTSYINCNPEKIEKIGKEKRLLEFIFKQDEYTYCYIDLLKIKEAYEMLGCDEFDAYFFGTNRPVLFKKRESESCCIIMPVRYCEG